MLDHYEEFELEKEYLQIWDKIRYKKVDEIYSFTEEVISLLDKHIDDKILFNNDYEKIQNLFKKMKQKNFFYQSSSVKEIIKLSNPKFEKVYKFKECVRQLKYIGEDTNYLKNGNLYKSTHSNGARYIINVDGNDINIGYKYMQRLS